MTGLAQALCAFQADAPALQKDAINPHFRSKFISLDNLMGAVLPVLNRHGLALQQFPTTLESDGKRVPALRTRIVHGPSGEFVEDTMLLQNAKDDPQGQGSAITYARRYAAMSILGLVADEDDDANKASRKPASGTAGGGGSTSGQRGSTPDPAAAANYTPPKPKPATKAQRDKIAGLIDQLAALRGTPAADALAAVENDYGPLADLSADKAAELDGKLTRGIDRMQEVMA